MSWTHLSGISRRRSLAELILCSLAAVVLLISAAAQGQTPGDAQTLLKTGRYDSAIKLGDQPVSVRWELQKLTSAAGAAETYEAIKQFGPQTIEVKAEVRPLGNQAVELHFVLTNPTPQRQMVRSVVTAPVPAKDFEWWNGFLNQSKASFDPADTVLSKWFPLNAALGARQGLGVGVNPGMVYSRVDSELKESGKDKSLVLALPVVLDPKESFELSHVVTVFRSELGYRDAIQNYYDLFPQVFGPAEGIDPRILTMQTSYIGWGATAQNLTSQADLIRRMTGGRGGWEWCYGAPARGGDWGITDQYTLNWDNQSKGGRRGKWTESRVAKYRQGVKNRLEQVVAAGSAPAWYVNMMYIERELGLKHFPNAFFNKTESKGWGQDTLIGIYPWGNGYGELFSQALKTVPQEYPMVRAIGWDSAFGHHTIGAEVEGVEKTKRRSFHQGNVIALEGAGHAELFDIAHQQQAQGVRIANVINLKLVSPYSTAVRADAALYEGSPIAIPARFMRIESMRARFGTRKPMSWHKHLDPQHISWIEWDRLSPEEIEAAYRQIQVDNLLLSYFWGGAPGPGLPLLGVEQLFTAMPELIDLVEQGWQPSSGVAVKGDYLVVRYGQGVGARLAVINPGYEAAKIEMELLPGYWPEGFLMLGREDGQVLASTTSKDGRAKTVVEAAGKSVTLVRVLGAATAERLGERPMQLQTQKTTGKQGQTSWTVNAAIYDQTPLQVRFYQPADAVSGKMVMKGKTTDMTLGGQTVVDTTDWAVDYQADYIRNGKFFVDYFPHVAVTGSAQALAAMKVAERVKEDPKAVAIVAAEGASDEVKAQAEKLRTWFAVYNNRQMPGKGSVTPGMAADTSATAAATVVPAPEIVTQSDAAVRLVLQVTPKLNAAAGTVGQIVVRDGSVEISGQTPEGLAAATAKLLGLLDQAYPYVGALPEDDPYLKNAGVAGKVLTAKPVTAHVAGQTLVEMMKQSGLVK